MNGDKKCFVKINLKILAKIYKTNIYKMVLWPSVNFIFDHINGFQYDVF